MIKLSLTRDEIEEALTEYARKVFSMPMLVNNDVKITQGKSASATIILIPKTATKEDTLAAIEEAEKDIEIIAGQPDIPVEPVTNTRMFS